MKIIGKIIKWTLIACIGFLCVLFGRGYLFYNRLMQEQTVTERVAEIQSDPQYVPYAYLPESLVKATVSIEDHRFFEHGGIDYIGLSRALASWFVPGMVESGGSTITQQLAKNMYNMFESSLDRKTVEFFIAKDLERNYSKEDIFELYVNVINYGDQNIGIYEASHGYFQKSVSDLSIFETTLLAGIPQSPANFQLSNHYEDALSRQRLVVHRMVENEYLTQEEADWILNQQ